ncbi:hypothetical protein QJQ45_009786 [Haematococcus lacustris]|nr:hypothetical protein QJQ45_009786 [Haematococcus lacustris]
MWCPVVAPPQAPTGPTQQPGSHTASSLRARAQHSPLQPSALRLSRQLKPTQPTNLKGTGKGKAAKAKPAPQPGRWLDRDCNAALNMQRIGESRWRPLELCFWPDQGALPAKGQGVPWPGLQAAARQATKGPAAAAAAAAWLRAQ